MRDLLIVGAGPAGCAAAIQACRTGLSVTVLEASERPRRMPGETLHPGIEPLFERLGVREAVLAADFHRHRGIWVAWDGPCRFDAFGRDAAGVWLGFQAERRRLHAILLDAARAAGAEIRQGATADAVIVEKGRVGGLVAGGREWRARWTADGTGRQAFVARMLRLEALKASPMLRARFGWREGEEACPDGQPRIDATPQGWNWRAPLGNGRTAWVSLEVGQASAASRSHLGSDLSWRHHPACAGPGYMLLGDAAVTLDPASSHGVLRALMSGMLCAHLVGSGRKGLSAEAEAIEAYRLWTHRQFEHDVQVLRTLYGRHPSPQVARQFRVGSREDVRPMSEHRPSAP